MRRPASFASLVLLLPFFFTGCGVPSPASHSYSEADRLTGSPRADRMTVVIHLPANMPPFKGTILVDGRARAELPAGAFTRLALSPGSHRIGIKYPAVVGPRGEDFSLYGQSGLVYHLRLGNGPGRDNSGPSLASQFMQSGVHFAPVSASEGTDMARHETFVPAR